MGAVPVRSIAAPHPSAPYIEDGQAVRHCATDRDTPVLQRAALCYNVLMSDKRHISIRVPSEVLDGVDAQAAAEGRSRSQVIIRRLGDARAYGQVLDPVAVLEDAGAAPQEAKAQGNRCGHKGHHGFLKVDGWWCIECGRLIQ